MTHVATFMAEKRRQSDNKTVNFIEQKTHRYIHHEYLPGYNLTYNVPTWMHDDE